MNLTTRLPFLRALLAAPGPSGFEARAAKVWADEAATFAAVSGDHLGNTYATIKPKATGKAKSNRQPPLRVMLSGHIDEIGVMVTHVDADGFVSFAGLGGWDAQVLVGQRLRLLAQDGDLIGVVGRKPMHLLESDERDRAVKLKDLTLDLGLDPEEVRRRVRVGDVAVIEQPMLEINVTGDGAGRIVSKAIDNRIGAFAVLEALRVLAEGGCPHEVTAVAATQEEIGAFGARVAAFRLEPDVALAVDVTFESKQPGVNPKVVGEAPFGSGASLTVAPLTSPAVLRGLLEAAAREGIPTTLSASARLTGTDADEIVLVRSGVPGGVISIPNRYMHSPSEMVELRDVAAVVSLMVAYVRGLTAGAAFGR